MKRYVRSRLGLVLVGVLLPSIPLLIGQGCPPIDDGRPLPGDESKPAVTVISPSVNRTAAIGDIITVLYDAVDPTSTSGGAMSVSGFYDHDGVAGNGDEVVFAPSLPAGTGKFTQLNTAGMDPGTLYIGVAAQNSAGITVDYAPGRVTLAATADVTFSVPASDIAVGPGSIVPVRFRAGTGVINFAWSLFYDTDGDFNNDEIVIATGSSTNSNEVESEWTIPVNQLPGVYFLGARVQPSGGGDNTAYCEYTVTVTTGPFLQILLPEAGLEWPIINPLPIVFAAGNPQGPEPQIRVFVDPDNNATNGNETDIATVLASVGGVVWRSTIDFEPGLYYIGAEMLGVVPQRFSYISLPIRLLGSGSGTGGTSGGGTLTLTMRNPMTNEIRFSGELYVIRWATNLTIGQGTIEVFREPDADDDGVPDGSDKRVQLSPPGLDASTMMLDFDTTGVVGKYFIGATVTPAGEAAQTDYANGTLTILPSMFWVGDLRTLKTDEKPSAHSRWFKGATFRGHNLGDNLGSAMLVGDDYDGDGVPDIVLAAQFAKPWLIAQGGRGAGEAYLIYGSAGRRYSGNYDVNATGSTKLPGTIFAGIAPNPNQPNTPAGYTGTTVAYTVDGEACPPFTTEGLRSLTLIPDQDNDGKKELVFAFPFCNSYSLWNQALDGTHPAPAQAVGRLENNGHFLRGGVVIISSTNSLLTSRTALSRHFDRAIMLQEAGQVFNNMTVAVEAPARFNIPAFENFVPTCCTEGDDHRTDGLVDTAFFPTEGFMQDTMQQTVFPFFGLSWSNEGRGIDPPRLATPEGVGGEIYPEEALMIPWGEDLSLSQVDPPPGPTSGYFVGGRDWSCGSQYRAWDPDKGEYYAVHPFGYWPDAGFMRVLGTGFYYDDLPDLGEPECSPDDVLGQYDCYCPTTRIATALEPYGCRILGQTTTQLFTNPPTTANLFAQSVSVSGDFLLIGAPNRTAAKADVTTLRLDPMANDRPDSGTVYMLQLKRPGVPDYKYLWNSQGIVTTDEDDNVTVSDISTAPAPHNYIIQDVGYSRCYGCTSVYLDPGDVAFEMSRPFHIVGQVGDHIGEVTGLLDVDGDGVDDFAVGGAGTHGDRGAVYVIYRRQPEIESDYLLERLQLDPNNLNRLSGLMILGRPGERLGTSIAGVGPRPDELQDDYNDDGYADVLIGSPNVSSGGNFGAGEVFVLFGGSKLLSPQGGITIPELRDDGHGMIIAGVQAYGRVGTTVASAGDINQDGIADIMISAPDASPMFDSDNDGGLDAIGLDLNGDRSADDLDGDGTPDDMTGAGLVYVVFGGEHLTGTIGLDQIGTENLPGLVFVGRKAGDHLGGGQTQNDLSARGLNSAGDLDGDGFDDIFLSSVLADPEGRTDAGEIYLVYGFSTPITPRH